MKFWKTNKVEFKIWFAILFAFLRVILQGVLWIQQSFSLVKLQNESFFLIEDIIALILSLYTMTIYFATAWEIGYEIISVIQNKIKNNEKE